MSTPVTNVSVRELQAVADPSTNTVSVRLELVLGDPFAAALQTQTLPPELVPGQKVPPKPETVVCGAITKPIKRTDPEFSTLVRNDNAEIVFKDEEGSAADRMMTTRLKEKLDALAKKVKSEWSGTLLRVTEAWDEGGEHAAYSLHYEGRAADLTTSPRDDAKVGRLGQLAVDAGLDWVFYEDATHIHASVKK